MLAENKLAKRYAQALFSLAIEAKQAEEIYTLLHATYEAVWGNKTICKIAQSRIAPRRVKAAFFDKIIATFAKQPLMQSFCQLVAKHNRIYLLKDIIAHYADMLHQQRGELQVNVISASAFSVPQEQSLLAELQKIYQKTIKLSTEVDSDLLAGFKLRIGSALVDFSLSTKMRKLRAALLATPVSIRINNVSRD